jgi:hypothetical protein
MIDLGAQQNQIKRLPALPPERYENIFNVYKTSNEENKSYYFYNILNKIQISDIIDTSVYDVFTLTKNLPWTTFSFELYETTSLWWLIWLLNKPENIFIAEAGKDYKYILPEYIDVVLTNILSQINV